MKRILASFILVLAALGLSATTASAHTDLVSSTPKDGATLDAAPTQIVLTFNEELLEDTVKIVAKSTTGDVGALSDVAQASGSKVEVPWPADAPGGTYELSYRIVSADGHPVTGSITFTYPDASSATAAPASPSASASASDVATPVPITETITASPVAEPTAETSSGTSPLPIILIGLGVGVVIGLIIFAVAKKRS